MIVLYSNEQILSTDLPDGYILTGKYMVEVRKAPAGNGPEE
jgi:hypothetical protein